ncbi:DsrE family protein [Clostridia bacterium]|nr:DsrE family protein [Clostridia bacterium]
MENKLTILWTNADPITSELMVFHYAQVSLEKKWWDEVEIVVWGATAKLVAENKAIQDELLKIKEKGVRVRFCTACATTLGVAGKIESLGFELEFMGLPLTEVLKTGGKLLTI